MDSLPQAFKAHAIPALSEKAAYSAYVFGAASPLGEAVLNQVLGSAKYTQVFVATQAPLPATIAHLRGFEADSFALQCGAKQVDVFFIAKTMDALTQVTYLPHIGTRQQVYKPLPAEALPLNLSQVSIAIGQANIQAVRWCVLAPDVGVGQLALQVSPYAAGFQSVVYGLGLGDRPTRQGTQFMAQGEHFLDRLGAGLLNLIARFMAQLANPKAGASLTYVKTAQRVMQRLGNLSPEATMLQLTPQDLAAQP